MTQHNRSARQMTTRQLPCARRPVMGVLLLATLALMLSSCGTPNQRYLLQLAPPECADGGHTLEDPVLMLDDFTTLPGMDRTAVFIAQDNVIQPSTVWYWEGNPAEIMTQAVSDRLECAGPYRVSWPYFGELEHAAVLRGRVREFQLVNTSLPEFRIRLSVELWGPRHTRMLAINTFTASEPVDAITPQATASAASKAVSKATLAISEWLDANRGLVTP
ncbi:hypothetical protein E8L03_14350 [Oceanidesulfovibrio marinus]|uniref:ABC-type transport auxiliary lipoprotein component domain-containing protein n=2 Tax=Oceanidesulfovibrio marinus TaxID=370038 RepID=A0ABX6NHB8_9BACT|nr:hypothetical protein E8L03_14350 [Oceanidesulfovibrio marinus]